MRKLTYVSRQPMLEGVAYLGVLVAGTCTTDTPLQRNGPGGCCPYECLSDVSALPSTRLGAECARSACRWRVDQLRDRRLFRCGSRLDWPGAGVRHCHRRPHPHHSTRPKPRPRARPHPRWVADLLRTGTASSSDVRDRSGDRWDRTSRARGIALGCGPGHGHVPRGVSSAWRCHAHCRGVPYSPQRTDRSRTFHRACGVAGRFLLPSVRCSVLAAFSGLGCSGSPGIRPAAVPLVGVECRWLRQRLISPAMTASSPGDVHVSSR